MDFQQVSDGFIFFRAWSVICFFAKKAMQIVVRCNEAQKQELTGNGMPDAAAVWVFEKVDLLNYKGADAVIDLLFENNPETIGILQQLRGLKIVNSVIHTLEEIDPLFVRINGWPTFLKPHSIEGSCLHDHLKKRAEAVFFHFNKSIEWMPDVPGFVTPRVISMIINEAHFALSEDISTQVEIDTAMKLGTAYPYGPFEWSEQIGLNAIAALLLNLSRQQTRYTPAPLLLQRAAVI